MIPLQATSALSPTLLAASSLIPYAGLADTARLVANPQRERDLPVAASLTAHVVSRGLNAALPTVIRGARRFLRARETTIHPSQQVVLLSGSQTRASAQLRRELSQNYPRAQFTNPLIQQALDLVASGRLGELFSLVAQQRPYLIDFQRPMLSKILQHVATHFPEVSGREVLAPNFLSSDKAMRAEDIFRPDMFDKVNSRGLVACSEHLFEREPAHKFGVAIQPEDTTLWRMIGRLPQGAVVADWGGGIGIAALLAKLMRPDLEVYVNDLHAPEVLMAHAMALAATRAELSQITRYTVGDPDVALDRNGRLQHAFEFPLTAAQLHSKLHYLTGDAGRIRLPEGKQANLMISASLSPYVPNPLGLFLHMYDQLAPGGIVASTVTTEILNASQDWTTDKSVISEFSAELARQGIPVEMTPNKMTLVVQRPDASRLRLTAEFLESSLGSVRLPMSPFMNRYTSFYRPNEGQRRWVERE